MPHPLLAHPDVRFQIDAFRAWVEAQRAYRELPGIAVGLVYDQELVWTEGFGYADRERQVPADERTVYRIASISKLFTATAIMQLRDAGKLQLDDPVRRHLPWFHIGGDDGDGPPITIRALLTHTAGLPREGGRPYWNDFVFPTPAELAATLAGQQMPLPVAQQWKYSNVALALAGEIVAAVSGAPYAAYVREHILAPLRMTQTYVQPQPDTPHLAVGYGRRLPGSLSRAISPFVDIGALTPAGNLASCVEDLARFAMLQFRRGPAGGSQILAGHTLAEMQRIHWLEPEWQAGWGLAFRIQRQRGKTYFGHGGALPGYRTQLLLSPAEKVAVIVMTNADDGEPIAFVDKAMEWLAPALAQAAQPAAAPLGAADLARYTGRYRNFWGDAQVLIHDGQLVAFNPSLLDPMPGLVTLTPVGEHSFRMASPDGYSSHSEVMVFELDDQGRVTRVKVGDTYSYPVAAW